MKKLLYVDEEKWYADTFLMFLEAKYGDLIDYDFNYNGVSAIQSFENNKYDCVILDIMMPFGIESVDEIFSGLIVLEKLRSIDSITPIICYTARNENRILETISCYKNVFFISKNQNVEDLWDKVDKCLNLS